MVKYKETIEGLLDEMIFRGIIKETRRNKLLIRIIRMALGFIVELKQDDKADEEI